MVDDMMVLTCPACSGKLRLDRQRHAGKKVALRCPRCRHIFQVGVEAQGTDPLQVLVAHGDSTVLATICEILARGSISCIVAKDGQEVFACLEKNRVQVAVIDVALSGIMAFEVVERIRSTPELASLKIILLSSVYNKTAYKRRPSSLYGADDYIEKHHLSDWLLPKIRQLATQGPGLSSPSFEKAIKPPREAVPSAFAAAVNSKILHAEEGDSGGKFDQNFEKARRLARIIISDIALYNQERFEEGLRSNNLELLLNDEIEEGRRLFASRISPEIRSREDFLKTALDDFITSRQTASSATLSTGA